MGGSQVSRHAQRMMSDFGKRLRAVRIASGYESAAEFAKDLGIGPIRYGHYERGRNFPPIDILASISKLTGKSLDFLLLGSSPAAERR